MLLRSCHGRTRNQPHSRIDGTQIHERPEPVPA
jgi:hypothetical protein